MCGILFTDDLAASRERFLSALGRMAHRGPDKALCYGEHGGCKLGHNRLRILDLDDRSDQPLASRDGRYVITYNGEIYNYRELARRYAIPMRTTCDTELLVELYARRGASMLGELNGMFAFVILDTLTGEAFVARDPLGIKPLYVARAGGCLTAASEIAAVLDLAGSRGPDEVGLRQYRKLRTFFGGRTAYAGISMFPAGHYMLGGTCRRYWSLPEGPQDDPSDEEIEQLVRSAVACRCIADVPVGSYLSGGLDSTIVAGLASKPHTWTVGFEDRNEFPWGRLAARRFGSTHSEVFIDAEEFVALAREMVEARREPLSVPNEVLLYKMTRQVKRHNTVVLSGEGADELFFGYDRIFRWAMAGRWDLGEFAARYAYGSNDDLEIVEEALAPYARLARPIDRVAAFFQAAHLHGLLRRLDNATMLCSVEARVPFVDRRLVERMAGVSASYRMAGGVVKAPLKRIFRRLVPSEIIRRRKVGFPVPLEEVLGPPAPGRTAMDRWLEFNLDLLTGGAATTEDIAPSSARPTDAARRRGPARAA